MVICEFKLDLSKKNKISPQGLRRWRRGAIPELPQIKILPADLSRLTQIRKKIISFLLGVSSDISMHPSKAGCLGYNKKHPQAEKNHKITSFRIFNHMKFRKLYKYDIFSE